MNYEISNNITNLIFSNSFISPLDNIKEVETDLKNRGIKGLIIFDLLLCVGFSSNRYVSIEFNGENLDISTSKILNTVSSDIKEESKNFYFYNSELLENSILNKAQKYIVKNKLV